MRCHPSSHRNTNRFSLYEPFPTAGWAKLISKCAELDSSYLRRDVSRGFLRSIHVRAHYSRND